MKANTSLRHPSTSKKWQPPNPYNTNIPNMQKKDINASWRQTLDDENALSNTRPINIKKRFIILVDHHMNIIHSSVGVYRYVVVQVLDLGWAEGFFWGQEIIRIITEFLEEVSHVHACLQ